MLDYFEKVIVISNTQPSLKGKIGVVLGISEEGGTVFSYQVHFDADSAGVLFKPDELTTTGEFADKSAFYDDDDTVVVIVENGHGRLSHD